jgi:hypothetical protein
VEPKARRLGRSRQLGSFPRHWVKCIFPDNGNGRQACTVVEQVKVEPSGATGSVRNPPRAQTSSDFDREVKLLPSPAPLVKPFTLSSRSPRERRISQAYAKDVSIASSGTPWAG